MPSQYKYFNAFSQPPRKRRSVCSPPGRFPRMSAPPAPSLMDRVAALPLDLHGEIISYLTNDTQFSSHTEYITPGSYTVPSVIQIDELARAKLAPLYYNQTIFFVRSEEDCVAWLRSLPLEHRKHVGNIHFAPDDAGASGPSSRTRSRRRVDFEDRALRLARLARKLNDENLHPQLQDALKLYIPTFLLPARPSNPTNSPLPSGYWSSRHLAIHKARMRVRHEVMNAWGPKCCAAASREGTSWMGIFWACCEVETRRWDVVVRFCDEDFNDMRRVRGGMGHEGRARDFWGERVKVRTRERVRRMEEEKMGKMGDSEEENVGKRKEGEWEGGGVADV